MNCAICSVRFKTDSLAHYGIKGQKHGLRRFQNEDGSYTEEGKRRYGIGDGDDRRGNGSNNDTDQAAIDRREKVKKALKIAGAVALAAAVGTFAYKVGKQWTGNLVKEYKNQTAREAGHWLQKKVDYAYGKHRHLYKAQDLDWKMKTAGGHYRGRALDLKERHWNTQYARDFARASGQARSYEDYYRKLGSSITRGGALKNYIKNRGKIVIPNIQNH